VPGALDVPSPQRFADMYIIAIVDRLNPQPTAAGSPIDFNKQARPEGR
jgi:hypothetical protein